MKGEMLGGRYRLEDRIGGGGMAWVWKAEDTLLHRPVAVKLLRDEFVSDEAFVRRFRQEAESAASLVHPNIVHVYDVGEERGMHYIVMELVEGETLKERIQRQGPLPIGRALQVATSVARALQAAHRKGIVHRDIKPQNILLTEEGRVKVADFGIARAASGTTIVHTTTVIGSAHYFAPEQARGGYTDEKSDLYSLGAVLYEMLTGQPPFEGATAVAVALKHLQEQPVAPRKRRPEMPRSVEAIVLRLLEKDPAKRYASADALLADLHRALDEIGEPVADEDPMSVGQPQSRGARRITQRRVVHRIWPWAVMGLALILVVYGGIRAFETWITVPNVKVAKVEGLQLTKAVSVLQGQGLHYLVIGHEHVSAPKGTVFMQNPAQGDVVKKGRVVQLVVSLGPQLVKVPNVVGQTVNQATAAIESANLQVKVKQVKSTQPQGTVVQQSPQGGGTLPSGSTIKLSVSLGPGTTQQYMPNFTGASMQQAETQLISLNVDVPNVFYAYSQAPQNTVLDQSVPAGTQITPNMTMTLTISEGLPPAGGSGPPGGPESVTVNYSGQSAAQVVVWVIDATGTFTVLNQVMQPNDVAPITVNWQGTGRIEEYVNGILVYSQPLPITGPITNP